MADTEGLYWASDVPISLPVPPSNDVIVDYGAFGLTQFGIVHNVNNADLENYIPTFLPAGGGSNE